MPSNSRWKSSRELIGTPTLPTSGNAIGASDEYPHCVGRSNAIDNPVCPRSRFARYNAFDAAGLECPAYVRKIHG
jgi:hypothetical protein